MIVRILGEGQFRVDDAATAELNQLDADLETAVEHRDEAAFAAALTHLLAQVRTQGSPLPPDTLESSDLILPGADSSMDEVRKMLTDEGLIPGLTGITRRRHPSAAESATPRAKPWTTFSKGSASVGYISAR